MLDEVLGAQRLRHWIQLGFGIDTRAGSGQDLRIDIRSQDPQIPIRWEPK